MACLRALTYNRHPATRLTTGGAFAMPRQAAVAAIQRRQLRWCRAVPGGALHREPYLHSLLQCIRRDCRSCCPSCATASYTSLRAQIRLSAAEAMRHKKTLWITHLACPSALAGMLAACPDRADLWESCKQQRRHGWHVPLRRMPEPPPLRYRRCPATRAPHESGLGSRPRTTHVYNRADAGSESSGAPQEVWAGELSESKSAL